MFIELYVNKSNIKVVTVSDLYRAHERCKLRKSSCTQSGTYAR